MTIRHLKVFVAVCECGGITRAAEKLCIAQPSVSFTVSELEKYYGVTLFRRNGQGIALTDEGRLLLVKAGQVIAEFEEFEELAHGAAENPTVKMGSSLTFGSFLVPSLIGKVKELYPRIKLRVCVNRTASIEEEVAAGKLDFAAVEGKVTDSAVISEPFLSDKLVAVCGAEYFADGLCDCGSINRYDWLLREKGSASRDCFDSLTRTVGVNVNPVVESSSNRALIAAAIHNCGIAVLPQELVRNEITSGQLREVLLEDFDMRRNSYLIRHKNKKFNDAQQCVYNLLKSTGGTIL